MCPIRLTRAHLASPCYRSSSNRSAVSLRCRHLALPALLLAAVCLCCTCGLTGRIRIFCVQVCVQGIPWKYTWKELKELLAECGEVDRADVMTAPDGRSKVRSSSSSRPTGSAVVSVAGRGVQQQYG
eukprot:GHUV01054989.1.p1 GENE.GHUV01054989.1~~GHUV01054989.1.p1  ORF type:complete len:127 (-),score=38.28 GHUV01054989.1:73-453(-)